MHSLNGRDQINPLDLLLLQDCLWHSPESRNVIVSIMKEFATKHAFNQQDAIADAKEALVIIDNINQDICTQLVLTFTRESTMRKEWFKYNFATATRFNINNNPRMIKLVMLQQNTSVSEQELKMIVVGFTLMVMSLIKKFDWECDIAMVVNKNNSHLCRLHV